MNRSFGLLPISVFIFLTSCLPSEKQSTEVIEIDGIGYDPYGRNCGGISINITTASNSKDKIGKSAFIKPSIEKYRMPDGLIASGNNKLKFFGHFEYKKCKHLMSGGDKPESELFFIYDSVHVYCPFKYWNSEKMEFDAITCNRLKSFHERIKVIQ